MSESSGIERREFIKTLAGAAIAPSLLQTAASQRRAIPNDTLIGIQMGPHTMLDEGIPQTLDLIQQNAAVNAVFTYSHAFHADLRKPVQFLAPDHGKPPRGERGRLPSVWVRHHDQYFRNTKLRARP